MKRADPEIGTDPEREADIWADPLREAGYQEMIIAEKNGNPL